MRMHTFGFGEAVYSSLGEHLTLASDCGAMDCPHTTRTLRNIHCLKDLCAYAVACVCQVSVVRVQRTIFCRRMFSHSFPPLLLACLVRIHGTNFSST